MYAAERAFVLKKPHVYSTWWKIISGKRCEVPMSDWLLGLVLAVVLVYMLIVINFQSWLDPFIIVIALPAALTGIVFFLFLTHTTLSVPALMGALMCMGIATANSVLLCRLRRSDPFRYSLSPGG
jgi:multidrug efflux pump subunit AcrB